MKTVRTIKQNSNGGFNLHGTPVIIIAMESGTITIKCRGEHHKVAIIIAPEGEAKLDTLCHDEENEKGERYMDEFANTGESGCECLRVKDWFRRSGIFIS